MEVLEFDLLVQNGCWQGDKEEKGWQAKGGHSRFIYHCYFMLRRERGLEDSIRQLLIERQIVYGHGNGQRVSILTC